MARWTVQHAAICATALATQAFGQQILNTNGFTNCESGTSIEVQNVDMTYDNSAKTVVFDVAGRSDKVQNVTAKLSVVAYGQEVYSNSFNPCDALTFVERLCPGKAQLQVQE
jgi:hypothetical protein